MNKISMAILEQERNKIKEQIFTLNRKVTLIEMFMSDFPNVEIEEAQDFIAFVNHTDFTYDAILDVMPKRRVIQRKKS